MDVGTFFITWTILSLLVTLYAHRKGLSPTFFFLISLLTSPLIGILWALAKAPDPAKVGERSGRKKCPSCAEWVQQEAKVCRFCRAELGGTPPAVTPVLETPYARSARLQREAAEKRRKDQNSIIAFGCAFVLLLVFFYFLAH
jgi:hypothetical protein